MEISVKENVSLERATTTPPNKSKKQTKGKQRTFFFKTTTNSWHKTSKIWNTIKKQNLRKIDIEEEESRFKDPEYIFHKIKEEKFLNLKKKMSIKIQQVYRTQNQFYQKRKSPRHIIKHLTYRTKKEC